MEDAKEAEKRLYQLKTRLALHGFIACEAAIYQYMIAMSGLRSDEQGWEDRDRNRAEWRKAALKIREMLAKAYKQQH